MNSECVIPWVERQRNQLQAQIWKLEHALREETQRNVEYRVRLLEHECGIAPREERPPQDAN